ncbi:MAG: hypothetical protein ACD_4C00221G0002 [uncultured bacterium (gcode 4)]|uniref:Uncharacterized protein n=1 Tax=uncultured bacterium (gcode 4) TaxID=1234023 RepID=K2F6E4_9BACT|nr:MAG: hypothetical protein ACD_4C00221G0002 [uncultured bacterium (gcode 4)]
MFEVMILSLATALFERIYEIDITSVKRLTGTSLDSLYLVPIFNEAATHVVHKYSTSALLNFVSLESAKVLQFKPEK